MAEDGLVFRMFDAKGEPVTARALAVLGGVLPKVPFVLNDQSTTLGALLSAIPGKQDGDSALASLAALALAADRLIYATGPDALATSPLTAFARTLLAGLDAQSVRQSLELGSAATRPTGDFLRLDATQALTAQRVAQGRTNLGIGTGDSPSFHGLTLTDELVVGQGKNASTIRMFDSDEGARFLHNNSGSIGFLASDGSWRLRVYDNGDVSTAQLGDLATAFNRRLRFDAAQSLTTAQRAQLFDNLAFNLVARTFVQAATSADMRTAIGLGAASDASFRDLLASRGDGSGVVHLNAIKNRYLFYSGAAYEMPGADLYVSGSKVWTEGTAAGSVSASGDYMVQRFPSGGALATGTTVVTTDANGRAFINCGFTALTNWWGIAINGGFLGNQNGAATDQNSTSGFWLQLNNSPNAQLRFNWMAFARWK